MHGTEYTSIAAARRFATELGATEPGATDLAGTVTIVPVVNLPAFWERSPFVVPADGCNLNRAFPGDLAGTYSAVLARRVHDAFIVGSDYLIDLHAGDLPEALEPFTMYEQSPVENVSRELALAYGLGHVLRQSAAARTVAGSTSAAAADLLIPAITAEAGQNGILDEASIQAHLAGLRNVLRTLGFLDGPIVAMPAPVEHDGWEWVRAPAAGWWEPAVPVGATVLAGHLLGTVTDLFTGFATPVRASTGGVPLFLTTSPAVQDGGLLLGLARGA